MLISPMDGSLRLVESTSPVWHIDAVRGPSTPSLRGAKRRSNPDSVIPGWCVSTRPQMCNCTSGNLEIPGSMLSHRPGMTRSGQCPPRSPIEETRDLMLRPGFNQRGRLHLAALHHIAAAGVEGAA